jgi:teichuronic acid biosynthesis glycosyltransferase TuaG
MTYASLPLVSVVIPSYNHAHFLPRALHSVQRQGWKNLEVLVVDNGSVDGTDDVLKAWQDERLRVLKVQNRGVIAVSRNKGIQEARGEWIAFLDSDDWWGKDKLQQSMNRALAGSDVVFHDLTMVGADGRVRAWRRSRSRKLPVHAYDDLVNNGCALPNSSVVVRKAALTRIGGICEEQKLVGWEDFDTWLRLAKAGNRFTRVPGSHGYYWVGGGSVSNPARTLDNVDAFIDRYVGEGSAIPWWCHYSRAVAYEALGRQECVGPCFDAAMRAHPGLLNYLRIICKRQVRA